MMKAGGSSPSVPRHRRRSRTSDTPTPGQSRRRERDAGAPGPASPHTGCAPVFDVGLRALGRSSRHMSQGITGRRAARASRLARMGSDTLPDAPSPSWPGCRSRRDPTWPHWCTRLPIAARHRRVPPGRPTPRRRMIAATQATAITMRRVRRRRRSSPAVPPLGSSCPNRIPHANVLLPSSVGTERSGERNHLESIASARQRDQTNRRSRRGNLTARSSLGNSCWIATARAARRGRAARRPQAQVPRYPYVGLWARLPASDSRPLDAIERRDAVRMPLFRATFTWSPGETRSASPGGQPVLRRGLHSGSPFGRNRGAAMWRPDPLAYGACWRSAAHPRAARTVARRTVPRPRRALPRVRLYLSLALGPGDAPRALGTEPGASAFTTLESWVGAPTAPTRRPTTW